MWIEDKYKVSHNDCQRRYDLRKKSVDQMAWREKQRLKKEKSRLSPSFREKESQTSKERKERNAKAIKAWNEWEKKKKQDRQDYLAAQRKGSLRAHRAVGSDCIKKKPKGI